LIIARTGWTTADLKAGIEAADPKGPFDLVSLLIGVNNQYRGPSRGYTTDAYRMEFAALLQQAIAFAGGKFTRVFVVSIPDYSVTPFVSQSNKARVAEEIDQYNDINRQETEKAGVTYIDITPISRLAANDASLLASDNLHPSASMYRMWVELMAEEVIGKVKTR
jgi:lysophospholipase L1-like esterase